MADIEHSDIGAGEVHIVYNWTYADAAARAAAAGLLSTDVGKIARQLDDDSLWMLIDESPVTWKDIGTSSSSRASNPMDDAGQMIVGGASGVETKLEPGAEGEFLQIVSGEPQWASAALTLSNDSVTNSLLANMAEATIKGRAAGAGTGDPTDLTGTQATAILDAMVGDSGSGGTKGLVPAPASGDATKFLKGDGTWAAPSGSGGATYSGAEAYVFVPIWAESASTTATVAMTANQVKAWRFFLPIRITIAELSFNLSTTSAGGNISMGIYSSDGNTRHIDTGPILTTAGGVKRTVLGATVTLDPGFYWLAWTADNGTCRPSGVNNSAAFLNVLNGDGNNFQWGAAGNSSSGGQLPATLGGVATQGSTTPTPYVKLQG